MNSQISLSGNSISNVSSGMNQAPNYIRINNYEVSGNKMTHQREKTNSILNEYYSASNGQNGLMNSIDVTNQYNYNNIDRKEPNEQNINSIGNSNNQYAPLINSSSNHRSLSEPRHHNNIIQPQLLEYKAAQQTNLQLPPPPVVPNYVQLQQQQQIIQNQQGYVLNSTKEFQKSNNRKSQVNFQTPLESSQRDYQNNRYDDNYSIKESYYNQNVEKQQNASSSSVETYDNLNDNQINHQSRIDSRYSNIDGFNQLNKEQQLNYFNRYNSSLKPKYNSMRIPNTSDRNSKTIDPREVYDMNFCNESNRNNLSTRNAPNNVLMGIGIKQQQQLNRKSCINPTTNQLINHANLRDIKSCEREFLVSNDLSTSTNLNNNTLNNTSTCTTILPVSSVTHQRDHSRSGSITPRHQVYDTAEMTEDDDLTTASGSLCFNTAYSKNEMIGKQHAKLLTNKLNNLNHERRYIEINGIESKNEHSDFLENDCSNENSKTKIKLMQNQLQTLVNIVNKALISRDLNQLATDYNMTCKYLNGN